jgi:hypothetical protein
MVNRRTLMRPLKLCYLGNLVRNFSWWLFSCESIWSFSCRNPLDLSAETIVLASFRAAMTAVNSSLPPSYSAFDYYLDSISNLIWLRLRCSSSLLSSAYAVLSLSSSSRSGSMPSSWALRTDATVEDAYASADLAVKTDWRSLLAF